MRLFTLPRLLLSAAALLATACGQSDYRDSAGPVADERVLRRGNGGDPETLDPARAEDVHAFRVLGDLYEGLLVHGADGSLHPGVADSWQVSEDGLRYTFHLREDARWSNGDPVVAFDFVAGLRRVVNPATASAYASLLAPIRNATEAMEGRVPVDALGVLADGTRSLTIELEYPARHFLSLLTMAVTYPVWTGAEVDAARFRDASGFVGNGPFTLVDWRPGERIRLRRNPLFRDAASVDIDVVDYFAVENPATEFNMYRAGELDITATVPASDMAMLRDNYPQELRVAPSLALYYLAFDLGEAPLDNLALRRALSMAIDREALVDLLGRGEEGAYGLVPDGVERYEPARYAWRGLAAAERQAEALRYYADAGYSADRPLRLTFVYDTGDVHETVALAVSAMWRDVLGVDVTLDKREWKYFLATRDRRDEWDVMRFAWSGDFNHPVTFTDILQSSSEQNLPGYVDARYDELLAAGQAAADADDGMRLIAAAEAEMLDDYPIAPLYFYVSKHLVSPAVTGFSTNVVDRHPSRYLGLDRGRPDTR